MTVLMAGLIALAFQTPAWTWTLYDDEGQLVLANEVPDTPQLRATFECEPGTGITRLSLYDAPMGEGFATVAAGEASATTQAMTRPDHTQLTIRIDHPVFATFLAEGAMSVTVQDANRSVEIGRQYLPTLRRFAERCGG